MGAGHSEGTLPSLGHEAWRVQGRVGGLGARRRVILGGAQGCFGQCVRACMHAGCPGPWSSREERRCGVTPPSGPQGGGSRAEEAAEGLEPAQRPPCIRGGGGGGRETQGPLLEPVC